MNWKQFLESKGISEDDFSKKTPAEMAQLHNEFSAKQIDDLKKAVEKAATPDQIEKAQDDLEAFKNENEEALKAFAKTDDLEKIKTDLEDAQAEIVKLNENSNNKNSEGIKNELKSVHKSNAEKIKTAMKNSGNNPAEFVVKAATLTTSIANNTNSMRIEGATQLAYRKLSMRDVFATETLSDNNSGTITYTDWDDSTSVRAAATRGEGDLFPESTARFTERTIKLKKIGDSIPISEEFGEDEGRFVGEVEDFLNINVMLEEDSQLYGGDNTGDNLEGLYTSAPVFDPSLPALAPIYSGIQSANLYDLIVKTKEFISRGKKSKFNPDFVMLNLKQINDLILEKNTQNDYLKPPFAILNDGTMMIGGCRVIESNNVAENTMVVGDSRFGKIYEGANYTLSAGYVGNQFGEDMKTLKARKRMLLLVKELNKQGFAKVENITAALTQLAS